MRELIDKWRKTADVFEADGDNMPTHATYRANANELEAALPQWTRITDNPDTWPDKDDSVLLYTGNQQYERFDKWGNYSSIEMDEVGCWWRPLCSIDYPPEDE